MAGMMNRRMPWRTGDADLDAMRPGNTKPTVTGAPVPSWHALLELLGGRYLYPSRQPGWAKRGTIPFQCDLPGQWCGYQRSHCQCQLGWQSAGRKSPDGTGDWEDYINLLPNGASHTMTFSPSLLRDPEHKAKFRAFLRGYIENGGTALQINMLDADMLRDAQKHPENYRHLLVRVTGYNAYFTSIGKELQDEIIARESHRM